MNFLNKSMDSISTNIGTNFDQLNDYIENLQDNNMNDANSDRFE